MQHEILDGLPQDEAGIVLTSAADRARSMAQERLHVFPFSVNEVDVSALATGAEGRQGYTSEPFWPGMTTITMLMKARSGPPSRAAEREGLNRSR
jgi:hypothetical protein